MDSHLILVFIFTAIVHFIATLAYSVRLVAIQTGKLAISLALFNIMVLVSRTANAFQGPLLGKKIDHDLATGALGHAGAQFHWFIWAASLGALLGALFIPTFQGVFAKFVLRFN